MFGVGALMFTISVGVIAFLACKTDIFKKRNRKIDQIIDFASQSVIYKEEINTFKHSDCSICLDAFTENWEVYKVKSCGHIFHTKWIEEYDKMSKEKSHKVSRCPLCKVVMK